MLDRKGDRLKRLAIVPELFTTLLSEGSFEVVKNPLPDDAVIVSSGYNLEKNQFEVVIRSALYTYVPDGGLIPYTEAPTIRISNA